MRTAPPRAARGSAAASQQEILAVAQIPHNLQKSCRTYPNTTCNCNQLTPLLVSKTQAAAMLSISLRSIGYLIANGRLRTRRIGGRTLIAYDELQRFVKSDRIEAIAA
jgi:excisionase family DNA binding protein